MSGGNTTGGFSRRLDPGRVTGTAFSIFTNLLELLNLLTEVVNTPLPTLLSQRN